MSKSKIESLKFRFDVSAYRLLGRELITDRITALFELVKNSYDANAENVTVRFEKLNPRSHESKLTIKDDGIGMTFEDIRDKWMVIGTSSKRLTRLSPPPYNRHVVGKKGVGRFAVDKIGAKLILSTTQYGSEDQIVLETDWSKYEALEMGQLSLEFSGKNKFFTDVDNKYWIEKTNKESHGTSLEITMISETWTSKDILRAYKELSKLISPTKIATYPFRIKIEAPEVEGYESKTVESIAIEYATLKVELGFSKSKNKQEILILNGSELAKTYVEERPCGLVKMTLYYFNQKAKDQFKRAYKQELIDGIKVYRDGLIATPFAEYADKQNEQKDLFGIDKRRYSYFFERLGTRDLIGWIDITDERNSNIIDATNRQDFVDNEAWQELKLFVIEQISRIEKYIKINKAKEESISKSEFKNAKDELGAIRKQLNSVKKEAQSEKVQKSIEQVTRQLVKTQASVQRSLKDYQELEQEKKQQENLYFSLVSLQTYSGMLSHITRTSLGRIRRNAEFINKWMPDPKYTELYKEYGQTIFNEMGQLDNAVDFLLKFAKDDELIEDINVKESLENIFHNIYGNAFRERNIKSLIEINKNLVVKYNSKSFEDIFENLIDNAFKSLEEIDGVKLIKCSAIVEKDKFVIYFSDNGGGIAERDMERIFDVFFTTTAHKGGAGMGLFIVKSRLEALNGTIQVVENELKPTGATFKIELPFKK